MSRCLCLQEASVTPAAVIDCLMAGEYSRCRNTGRYAVFLSRVFSCSFIEKEELRDHTMNMLRLFMGRALPDENTDEVMSLALDIIENPERTSSHYRLFTIPKKSGGKREIEAPEPLLKRMLRAVLDRWWYKKQPPDIAMHGFVPGRGCLTNANVHVMNGKYGREKVLLKTDFSDLFPSISRMSVMNELLESLGGWLMHAHRKRKPIPILADILFDTISSGDTRSKVGKEELEEVVKNGYSNCGPARDSLAWRLAFNEVCLDWALLRLCCLDERLPQGSPCSPVLANIFTRRFHQIARAGIEKEVGPDFDYTVYADDTCTTFPLDQSSVSKADIARKVLYRVAYRYPDISINLDKTGLFKPGMPQRVTGITITDKLSISRKDRDKVRAELHAAVVGKKDLTDEDKMRLRGVRAWMRGVDSKGWDSRCEDDFLKVVGK